MPSESVKAPINVLAFCSFSLLVLTGPNGVASTAPKQRMTGREISGKPFRIRYITKPSRHIGTSDVVVTPTELLALLPDIICPEVTTGPKPPPEITLLNALKTPIMQTFLQENRNVRLLKSRIPIAVTNRPM